MLAVLLVASCITFISLTAVKVQNNLERSPPSLSCSNILCIIGHKCVMEEPQNCYGCALSPRCVQQKCNTVCILPCPFNNSCILVATNCCPKPTCRSTQLNTLPPPVETDSP